MRAHDIMTRHPSVVVQTDSVASAARLLRDRHIRMLPVVDTIDGKRLLGVITDHDIIVRCVAKGHDGTQCPVGAHMTGHGLVSVSMDAEVHEVIEKMERAKL